jgi:hypothetical protein
MWQIIGASVVGTSHARLNTPCQDAHAYRLIQEHIMLAAVADGLGSAPRSSEGSDLVVNTALDQLEFQLVSHIPNSEAGWETLLQSVFSTCRESLLQYATEQETRLREFATTLIMAVMTEAWLAVGQIGDGAIVIQTIDGQLETLSAPQIGEYVNEVIPLTADNALENIDFVVRANIRALALLTDGLRNLCLTSGTQEPYAPFFLPFFDALPSVADQAIESEQLAHFLNSDRVNTRTDDDKTLVLMALAQIDSTSQEKSVLGGEHT